MSNIYNVERLSLFSYFKSIEILEKKLWKEKKSSVAELKCLGSVKTLKKSWKRKINLANPMFILWLY